jgi:hypothetical protein
MIVAVLANNFLGAIGVIYIIITAVKITRKMPVSRWFF